MVKERNASVSLGPRMTLGVLVAAVLLLGGAAFGCGGSEQAEKSSAPAKETVDEAASETGVTFSQVEPVLKDICAKCHTSSGIQPLLDEINTLKDADFSEAGFPDSNYPAGLTKLSVQQLIDSADPADDARFDPGMAQRKAWTLHELNELKGLLAETVPPDFTSKSNFDAFAVLGKPGAYEGCEIIEKLDLGHENDPEGMPPLWSGKLAELLGMDLRAITLEERELIKGYTGDLLPGNPSVSCK